MPDKRALTITYLLTQDLESPTGGGRFLPLARALAQRGHNIHILALHSNFGSLDRERFTRDGVDIWYVSQMHVKKSGNLKTYFSSRELASIVYRATTRLVQSSSTIPADIIHLAKPHPMNGIAGLLARYLRGRMVFVDCDDDEVAIGNFSSPWQKNVMGFFEGNLPRFLQRVTTNTHHTRDKLLQRGIDPERIIYLSNGVDPDWLVPPPAHAVAALRARLDLDGRQVVAFIGSLSRPGHPVELLFSAFQRLHRQMPGAVLLIVGGGDDFDRLQKHAAELGLEHAVRFTGRVSPQDVPLYYQLADASVDPVLDDIAARGRSPLKLFESWASGIPFVTGDVGDRRRLLGDPPAGVLVDPADPAALAAALAGLLRDPALSADVSRRGRELIQAYTWDHLAAALESAYYASLQAG